MKKERKDAFQIKLEKETRRIQKKSIKPIIIACIVGTIFISIVVAITAIHKVPEIIGAITVGVGTFLICLVYSIIFTILMGAVIKQDSKKKAYKNIVNDINKSLVDKVLMPGEHVEVVCIDTRDVCYSKFILDLQNQGKIKFYAVLGKDGSIKVYAILEGETKEWEFDVASKEEFLNYYQFLDS